MTEAPKTLLGAAQRLGHPTPSVILPRRARPRWRDSWLTATVACAWLAGATGCATVGAGSPTGGEEKPGDDEQQAMVAMGKQVKGKIVWSSSRLGNHDLFVMNTDGSGVHPITKGENVDWFPRFSPNGTRILFTRSKKGWVFERDANTDGKWDIFTVAADGGDEKKVVDNASWGSWVSNDQIVYARTTRIYRRALEGGEETMLVDSEQVKELEGALMQQPEMSKDGKYIAITLRGSRRETGIWDIARKKWRRTGEGCQINWTPSGGEIYWVHPTGNGGSRVLHMAVDDGKPTKTDADADPDAMTLIDIPGRRSHEYFPQLSADGKWLVWAATQRGHDHDIADYEIYLWKVGAPPETATRLTYHSGNDRWPDIFIAGSGSDSGAVSGAADRDGDKAHHEDQAAGQATANERTASAESNDDTGDGATGLTKKTGKKKKAKR